MRWTVGTKIGAGFALAFAILIGIGSTSYRSVGELTATAAMVSHTHQVLTSLEAVLSDLKDAETGGRGFVITGDEAYLEPFVTAQTVVRRDLATLRDLTKDNAGQQRRLDVLEPLVYGGNGKLAAIQKTVDARRDGAGGLAAAAALVRTNEGKTLMDEIRREVSEMKDVENALLATRSATAQASARNTILTIVWGTVVAAVILGLTGLAITRNIARPLQDLTDVAERITTGDLSAQITIRGRRDEVGALGNAFERMMQSLRGMAGVAELIAGGDLRSAVQPQSPRDVLGTAFARMIQSLRDQTRELIEGANVLGSAASEIVASTSQLASSASESAAAVSETTITVEEVRQTAQVSSQKAKNVLDSAQRAAQISVDGRKATEDMAGGMARIRQQMDSIGASMERLNQQGQTIGQIIATVEDLAAQSNLLSVNAAIEAAKAGVHGKGFAVVAQEVKSLAEQSRQATTQVRTILGDIQKATSTAVLATEQGSKAVEAGIRQSEVAGGAIHALGGGVTEAAQAATQIAASSQQQLVGVDQVAGAMANIKQASTQNAASAQQLEVAARNINNLGQRLKGLVEHYKV